MTYFSEFLCGFIVASCHINKVLYKLISAPLFQVYKIRLKHLERALSFQAFLDKCSIKFSLLLFSNYIHVVDD